MEIMVQHLAKIHIRHPCVKAQAYGCGLWGGKKEVWQPEGFIQTARGPIKHDSNARVTLGDREEVNRDGQVSSFQVIPLDHAVNLPCHHDLLFRVLANRLLSPMFRKRGRHKSVCHPKLAESVPDRSNANTTVKGLSKFHIGKSSFPPSGP
jgi:hypothetical protein